MVDNPQAKHGKPIVAPILHFRIEEQVERIKQEPATKADVQAARERVSAELEFIGYA